MYLYLPDGLRTATGPRGMRLGSAANKPGMPPMPLMALSYLLISDRVELVSRPCQGSLAALTGAHISVRHTGAILIESLHARSNRASLTGITNPIEL